MTRNTFLPTKGKSLLLILLLFTASYGIAGDVYISEFVASNKSSFKDQFDEFPDWIEIHNNSGATINLQNWSISDDVDKPRKWIFPSISMAHDSYLVIFASDRNISGTGNFLHTNFKLSAAGESLILSNPNNVVVSGFSMPYPQQYEDISYAYVNGEYVYLENPTPQKANTGNEYLSSPVFSQPRGVYSNSFSLTLSCFTANTIIKYTTDGSAPNLNNGTVYNSPLNISETTIVRAVCVNGANLSPSVTYSYIFPNEVLIQKDIPNGYPALWGTNIKADYGMDPEVCAIAENRYHIIEALNSLPTVSLTTSVSDMFSNVNDAEKGGIYAFTTKTWERPASMEIIEPDNKNSIQVNCGVRIQGGASRIASRSPKHSFRLLFKSEYGPSKLKYDIFDDKEAAESFNSICLKAGYNNTWIHMTSTQRNRAQYIRDVWAKSTYMQMGNLSLHTEYVNLFVNGIYWGLYNISERIDGDFMESYRGGSDEEYDVLKDNANETVSGTKTHWDNMMAMVREGVSSNANYNKILGKNADGSENPNLPAYINAQSLADYMLLNFYSANLDWDHKNWTAARHQNDNTNGFCFVPWDQEMTLASDSTNILNEFNANCPSEIFQALISNEEFKLLFADRAHKHLFNQGVLTPEVISKNWNNFAAQISDAIYAESARWGDYRMDIDSAGLGPHKLYTVDDWEAEKSRLLYEHFPVRTNIFLEQLRDTGWYPRLEAPVFSVFGGEVSLGFELEIFANEGEIFYSVDGTDPRLQGGATNAIAEKYGTPIALKSGEILIKSRAKSGSEWSALTEATFKVNVPVGIKSNMAENTFRIAPNPVSSTAQLLFTLPAYGETYFEIRSVRGELLMKRNLGFRSQGTNSFVFDVTGMNSGLYICIIKCGNYFNNTKMIVRK